MTILFIVTWQKIIFLHLKPDISVVYCWIVYMIVSPVIYIYIYIFKKIKFRKPKKQPPSPKAILSLRKLTVDEILIPDYGVLCVL